MTTDQRSNAWNYDLWFDVKLIDEDTGEYSPDYQDRLQDLENELTRKLDSSLLHLRVFAELEQERVSLLK